MVKLLDFTDRFNREWTINPSFIISISPSTQSGIAEVLLINGTKMQIKLSDMDEFIKTWKDHIN